MTDLPIDKQDFTWQYVYNETIAKLYLPPVEKCEQCSDILDKHTLMNTYRSVLILVVQRSRWKVKENLESEYCGEDIAGVSIETLD